MTDNLRNKLIGAWKLVSFVEKPLNGSAQNYPMGERPTGIIMYTPDGYMSAQLMRPTMPRSFFPASETTMTYARSRPVARRSP